MFNESNQTLPPAHLRGLSSGGRTLRPTTSCSFTAGGTDSQPGITDEFSYLLMGDTFAHGRVNKSHTPMWIFFESFRMIQKSTYASMYYPAQGLFMALGQRFLGHPFGMCG